MPSNVSEIAVNVTICGLVIVFLMLVLLVVLMKLFGYTMTKAVSDKHKDSKPQAKPQGIAQTANVSASSQADDDEIVAVIAAAVASLYEGTGKRPVIRSIRPSGTRPAWSTAGLIESMRPFY